MDQLYTEAVCPVCSQADSYFIRKYKYQNPIYADCALVGCNNCTMVFAYPLPDEEELRKYNAGYFDNAHGGMSTHPLTVAFYSAISLLRMLHVQSFSEANKVDVKKVLEIGPGGGHFAKHWMQRNPATSQYTGVESDATCYENLKKYKVDVYAELDAVPQDSSFDLVVISHVLEHTTHPAEFINNCTKKLTPGGILFIEVPCNDYQHKSADEPHLLFFDKEPMYLLLQKTGYEKIQLSYHGDTITNLSRGISSYGKFKRRVRNFLLNRGVISLFAGKEIGLEGVNDPMERAMIKPFKAHIEQGAPAWWLRATAIKK
jgi:SAM-dependent methyltransferase